MQGFALNNISDCYVGSNQASAIYLGNTLIWPTTPPHDYSRDYLTFEALEPTSFSFTQNDLQYSLDNGSTWTTLIAGNSTPQLSTGDKILWKASGLSINHGANTFNASGNFNVYGNIMSLLYGDNFIGQTTISQDEAFSRLFYQNTKLINASNLILPATSLTIWCYSAMFSGCTSLISAPTTLPATNIVPRAYNQMFMNCTSLTTAPNISATVFDIGYPGAFYGYYFYQMFENCTSLTTAPSILQPTILYRECYYRMFYGCTSLTTAPELPANALREYCYQEMFKNCTSLNYVKCLATSGLDSSYMNLSGWLDGVSSTGTFVKDASVTWPTGGIPSGWTIINA